MPEPLRPFTSTLVPLLVDNVDTDQIIPAQYLSFNPSLPEERKFFGMYAMSSVPEKGAGLPGGGVRFVRVEIEDHLRRLKDQSER